MANLSSRVDQGPNFEPNSHYCIAARASHLLERSAATLGQAFDNPELTQP